MCCDSTYTRALTFENLGQVFQSVIALMICLSFALEDMYPPPDIYPPPHFENLWQVFQSVIALTICLSFVLDVTEAELGPEDGSSMMHLFFMCDWFFSCAFLAELCINLFGYG